MTRKDYEVVAEALAEARPDPLDVDQVKQWQRDVVAIAAALIDENPRFNQDRFLDACCFVDANN